MPDSEPRIRVAVVDDFEVIVAGVAQMLRPYAEQVEIVELVANRPVTEPVDIVLYDSFAQGEAHSEDLRAVLDNPRARAVVMFTWNLDPELVDLALRRGVAGYLSKQLSSGDFFDALRRIHAGEVVVAGHHAPAGRRKPLADWPGREHALTEREAEVLALITAGHSNQVIARTLYVSINSVKTHVRNLYRKIGAESRAQAVLWGVEHGFRRDRRRIDDWNTAAGRPATG
jgi:DNA-binding NarL/FixJ family response regulator